MPISCSLVWLLGKQENTTKPVYLGTYTAFKRLRSARCFVFKEVSFAHQGCIYLIKNVKYMYIYICIYMYVCMYVCMYVYVVYFCDAKLNFYQPLSHYPSEIILIYYQCWKQLC